MYAIKNKFYISLTFQIVHNGRLYGSWLLAIKLKEPLEEFLRFYRMICLAFILMNPLRTKRITLKTAKGLLL